MQPAESLLDRMFSFHLTSVWVFLFGLHRFSWYDNEVKKHFGVVFTTVLTKNNVGLTAQLLGPFLFMTPV